MAWQQHGAAAWGIGENQSSKGGDIEKKA